MARAKKDEQEVQPAAKRGLCLQIPKPQEAQLRKLSERAKIPIGKLVEGLEGHPLVADAITEVLKRRHSAWLDTLKDDIFAGLDREKEGSNAS